MKIDKIAVAAVLAMVAYLALSKRASAQTNTQKAQYFGGYADDPQEYSTRLNIPDDGSRVWI